MAAQTKAAPATAKKKPAVLEKAEWKPRYYKGRSYVSLQAVATYYGFSSLDLSGKQISMSISDPPIRFDALFKMFRLSA